MVTSIPTFRLQVSEGIIDEDISADRLFGYCIEANKGPMLEPKTVHSAEEAKRIFGVDFGPHFAQNPLGLTICRVKFTDAAKASYEYKMFPEGTTSVAGSGEEPETTGTGQPDTSAADADKKTVLKISAVSEGPCDAQVYIRKAKVIDGFDLVVKINEPDTNTKINKVYSNIRTLPYVAKKINNLFGTWLQAEITEDYEAKSNIWFDVFENNVEMGTNDGKLTGGSNGKMLEEDASGVVTVSNVAIDDETNGLHGTATGDAVERNRKATLRKAFTDAFNKIQEIDLIGIAVMSEDTFVQDLLAEHIEHVIDPEIHQLRFGIIGYADYKKKEAAGTPITIEDLKVVAQQYDNPWIIYIGQGVEYVENGISRKLYPHEAVQLYTGIRSSLGYAEAIFGGEEKKVLKNVTNVLPLVTDGSDISREVREDLNVTGVCTFKKEYGEVTFLEGVTTVQDEDVLSYENMMSIVANVIRRLIRICKPYQGQLLTEDLKATLTTALSTELQDITNNEGTLMAIEDFNIPPYDVKVYSAGKTKFNEAHKLVRENKIIVQCRIVPVGALRDIDLGVIVI